MTLSKALKLQRPHFFKSGNDFLQYFLVGIEIFSDLLYNRKQPANVAACNLSTQNASYPILIALETNRIYTWDIN